MLEKERNKIMLGKYKFKEGILNLFSFKKTNTLKLYKDYLNKNLKTLKRIDVTTTRANIEMNVNKKSSIPAFDWQVELVSLNNIIAAMLGIIDARSDENERELQFQKRFNKVKEIEQLNLKQKKLREYREKVIQDYETLVKRDDMKVINETIKCNPSYKNFDNLFNDMKENSYNLVIQGQLINAYMFGYNNSLFIFPQEIIPYYNLIINEYKLDKVKNNYNYEKVKKLTK